MIYIHIIYSCLLDVAVSIPKCWSGNPWFDSRHLCYKFYRRNTSYSHYFDEDLSQKKIILVKKWIRNFSALETLENETTYKNSHFFQLVITDFRWFLTSLVIIAVQNKFNIKTFIKISYKKNQIMKSIIYSIKCLDCNIRQI